MKQIKKRHGKEAIFVRKDTIRKDFEKMMKDKKSAEIYKEEMAMFLFVEKLQEELERKHLTRYALAKRAGLKPQVVSQVMEGENAEVRTLVKLANGLGKKLILKLA